MFVKGTSESKKSISLLCGRWNFFEMYPFKNNSFSSMIGFFLGKAVPRTMFQKIWRHSLIKTVINNSVWLCSWGIYLIWRAWHSFFKNRILRWGDVNRYVTQQAMLYFITYIFSKFYVVFYQKCIFTNLFTRIVSVAPHLFARKSK